MTPGWLLAMLAAAAQGGAAVPSEFTFARDVLGGWRMEASTLVEMREELGTRVEVPLVRNMRCAARGRGLRVVYSRYGGIDLQLDNPRIALHDILGLELGGTAYETRTLPTAYPLARYDDVAYPPGFVDPPAPAHVPPALVVRGGPAEPWLPPATLINELLEASRLVVRHRTASGEARLTLSAAGLREALRWCEEAFASDRARRLRQD